MRRYLGVLVLGVLGSSAFGQSPVGSSTVTAGVGGSFPFGAIAGTDAIAPTFIGDYEFRIRKYIALDIGVENALPIYTIYCGDGCFHVYRVHTVFLPVGAGAVKPLRNGRFELFAGLGAAYTWHSEHEPSYNPGNGQHALNQWLWQANAGARFALDPGHHYWVGSTVRYYRDGLGTSSQEYLSWTGDFSFRFGR